MRRSWKLSLTALLLSCGLQFVATAATAAPCDGSSDPCSIDLGRATANFATGAASYYAEAVLLNGTDAYYGVNPQFLPTVQLTHSAGSDGFTFQPQMYASVGGSGIQGLFEVAAMLQFTGLTFAAQPGYQITRLQAVVKGSFSLVGNGYGGLSLPGPLQWVDQNFTATVSLDPAAADFQTGFTVAASYVEGEEGTALSYGTASASIDSVAFIVGVSPVPEPDSWAMLAAGGVLLPWLVKRRSRHAHAKH
jgi:hypothetical protein